MILLLYILSILCGASGDGLNDSGKKTAGHILKALEVLCLLIVVLYYTGGFGWLIAAYIALRVALFDVVYNLTSGKPLCYHGTSSLWDKFVGWFNPPCWAELFGRVVFLIFAIVIPLQNIK